MCIQGVPPATLAEFTLSGSGNVDYYDGTDHMYHDVVPHVLNNSPSLACGRVQPASAH